MLDQLPNAKTVARSAPEFWAKDADVDRTSLAVSWWDDHFITSLIQLATVSTDAGVKGCLVIRKIDRFLSLEVLRWEVQLMRVLRVEKGYKFELSE